MKKCKHCGMIQSDDNAVCLDCSSPLGESMSAEENMDLDATLKKQVDDLVEKSDEFYIPVYEKIMGIACWGLIVIAIVLIWLANHQYQQLQPEKISQITINETTVTLPKGFETPTARMKELQQIASLACYSILFYALTSPMLLAPRFMWKLKTYKYRVHYGWDTPESHFTKVSRKISAYGLFGIGTMILLYAWILLL